MFPTVEPLGAGMEHNAYLVNGDLVVRFRRDPVESARVGAEAGRVAAEARVLRFVAGVSPVPVPRPTFVDSRGGCLAWPQLPGVPLIGVQFCPARGSREAVQPGADRASLKAVQSCSDALRETVQPRADVAARLGAFLSALHAVPPERVADFAEVDDAPPEEWLAEARELWPSVAAQVPATYRSAVEAFLADPAPDPAPSLVFSHLDLGIEHVLVDPGTGTVTGIIDWSDSAVGDPARDYGLILRDLGPSALAAASPPDDHALAGRIWFYARCGLIADLAFGLETGRQEYVTKSLTGLSWLFQP